MFDETRKREAQGRVEREATALVGDDTLDLETRVLLARLQKIGRDLWPYVVSNKAFTTITSWQDAVNLSTVGGCPWFCSSNIFRKVDLLPVCALLMPFHIRSFQWFACNTILFYNLRGVGVRYYVKQFVDYWYSSRKYCKNMSCSVWSVRVGGSIAVWCLVVVVFF